MKEEETLTEIYKQYNKGKDYLNKKGLYAQTDKNNKFYIGDQWDGADTGNMPMPIMNIIKPICDYKIGIVAQNNMVINYSSENFDEKDLAPLEDGTKFKDVADKTMEILNKYASKVWENNNMEAEMWNFVKEACVSGSANAYFYTKDSKEILETIDANNIYFSDENDTEVQNQDYILITFRRPVDKVKEEARQYGADEETLSMIKTDKDTLEQIGNKEEVETKNGKCLCILKLFKKKTRVKKIDVQVDEYGQEQEIEVYEEKTTVHMVKSTKNVVYVSETDLGLTLYPIAKLNWIEEKGSSRGRGEPQSLINNQIELNKNEGRRLLASMMTSYPKLVYLNNRIEDPSKLDKVGVGIGISGNSVQDVRNAIDYLRPAQISPDAKAICDELQQNTKELAGAGDVALGNVDPTQASGRAIIAVKDASAVPLNSQVAKYRKFVEDIARIWFDIWQNTETEGKQVIFEEVNPQTKEMETKVVNIPYELLQRLKPNYRVDISNSSPYSKFAQEQSLENLFTAKEITFEEYVEALPNDSVMPKVKLEKIIEDRREKELELAKIEQDMKEQQMQYNNLIQQQTDQEINNIEQDVVDKQDQINQLVGGNVNEMQSM